MADEVKNPQAEQNPDPVSQPVKTARKAVKKTVNRAVKTTENSGPKMVTINTTQKVSLNINGKLKAATAIIV